MSTSSENHDHHQCHQEMISKLVKCQEEMFEKLVNSQEKLVKSQEVMFGKLCKVLKRDNVYDDEDDDVSMPTEEVTNEVSQNYELEDEHVSEIQIVVPEEGGPAVSTEPDRKGYEVLNKAAKFGDWNDSREFFKNPEELLKIQKDEWKLALNIAVVHNQLGSLEEIFKLMPPEALEYETRARARTPLHDAAMYGHTEAAKVLVNKNADLTQIRDVKGRVPLQVAVLAVTVEQTETVKYLYSVTRHVWPSPFSSNDGARLLCSTIDANFYEIALSLVKRFPKLVTEKSPEHGICGLELITQRPFAFVSGARLSCWQRTIYSLLHIKQHYIHKQKLMHKQALALVSEMFEQIDKAVTNKSQIVEYFNQNSNIIKTAIKHGTKDVVVECLEKFRYLIWHELGGQTMIQMAIAERNEKIFDVICEKSGKDKIDLLSRKDKKGYTLLHHAAKIAPPVQLNSICGIALQVQRELQWFKGVKTIIPEDDKVRRNRKGYTAQFIFTQEHKELVEKGGDWMKDTSRSCMVVAALIATMAFAAIPKNETPVFSSEASFLVFAIADSLALFSSITSVLMFLAINTSRHAEEDFYKSLPQKLIIGLATLFISMATILVAFGASLFLLGDRFVWWLIAFLGCIPLVLFASLQLPLFFEMVKSTYWNNPFAKHRYIQRTNDDKQKEN